MPQDLYHKVLLQLHSSVIPNMMSPNMLADFLTYSLNQGELGDTLITVLMSYSMCMMSTFSVY